MKISVLNRISIGLLLCTCAIFANTAVLSAENRMPVTVEKDSKVPLRILTRPGAVLYADSEGKKILKSNIPTFTSYYVYTRPLGEAAGSGDGWYEIGSDDRGSVKGWMKGADLFEWKQTMCLTFSHPDGRNPVLMFDDDDVLNTLIDMPEAERNKKLNGYYEKIEKAAARKIKLEKDFPIVSIEPKMAVDNIDKFTLIPIIDYKVVEFEGRESRLLDVLAVNSTDKDRKESDIRKDDEYLINSNVSSESQAKEVKNLKWDIVWVIDTTRSMRPYIDRVREVMLRISENLAGNQALKGKVAFGIWGYRDSLDVKGLEYVTRNFTPDLQDINDFIETAKNVEETKVDSVTFDEDMFSGIHDAVVDTKWRDDSIKVVILVGDAPGHKQDHKWNATKLDQDGMRQLANEKNTTIFAIHINPPKSKKHNKTARKQFETLSLNPGTDHSVFFDVEASDIEQFDVAAAEISEYLSNWAIDAEAALLGKMKREIIVVKPDAPDMVGPGKKEIERALHAAVVTWLGNERNVAPPRDIEAWVSDKDLMDSTRQALEVQLLLSKAQLDAISTLLKEVIVAGETNMVSGEDFFTSLQAASAVVARDPDKLAKAGNIAESGLIPDFLKGLPYKSRLMEINNEVWEGWGPDEQNAFLSNLEGKLKVYSEIHDNTEKWVSLNEGDDPDDYVAPIPLDLMP